MNNKILFNNIVASEEQITCPYCPEGRTLNDYKEYENPDMSNLDFMKSEENTFDPYSGCFVCNSCYVNIGMPSVEKLKDDAFLRFRLQAESLPQQDSNAITKYLFG